jgi:pimeloyl-ACP methyl ester carboxylesterase
MVGKIVKSFDGTKIYYDLHKKGKQVLVFLHGWPHNHTVWKKELTYFQRRGYSTIALDLRGHGKSGMPGNLHDYAVDKFAKDIHLVAKKEEVRKFVLIGHSFGGMIALAHYSLFPKDVSALVLIDTIYENPLKHSSILKHFDLTPLTEHLLKFVLKNEKIQKKYFKYIDFSRFSDHFDLYYWFKGAEETPWKSIFACLEEMIKFNKRAILSKITVPTLIIEGEKDTKTAIEDVREMARKIKTSELEVVAGASHDVNIRRPRKVEEVISKFLKAKGLGSI